MSNYDPCVSARFVNVVGLSAPFLNAEVYMYTFIEHKGIFDYNSESRFGFSDKVHSF